MSDLCQQLRRRSGLQPCFEEVPLLVRATNPTPCQRSRTDALRLLQRRLTDSQWLPEEDICRIQARQIAALLIHAGEHQEYYKSIIGGVSPAALRDPLIRVRDLPVLRREVLQNNYAELCSCWPARHGAAREFHTSGSTGQPVRVRRTDRCQLIWLALTLRDHLWHQRNFAGTLASIRALPGRQRAKSFPSWGEATDAHAATGPMHVLPVTTDVRAQALWLAAINPDYLLSYPSNLVELLRVAGEEKLHFSRLREIRTIGETVSESLREALACRPAVSLTDLYSSQELGVIALQCPKSGLYHVQAESVFVEVLDEQGEPCRPGEIGRVVVTDLHNLALPLIRYEVGDYAEVGPACTCGRGLPTLRRILGRRRSMLIAPNGQRHWPHVPANAFRDAMPGLKQCQLVQKSREEIEVRLVVDGAHPLHDHENRLAKAIHAALGFSFELTYRYQTDALPRTAGGKFEEFVCEVR